MTDRYAINLYSELFMPFFEIPAFSAMSATMSAFPAMLTPSCGVYVEQAPNLWACF
jgi:hypothetical protein